MERDWYGWMGSVLRVDLMRGKVVKKSLDKEVTKKYLGGRGLNTRTLFNEVKPGIDPLSRENVLCLSSGPFTGTPLSLTSRIEVSTLSSLSGNLGDGNAGGYFPNELKRAGFDQVVITGKTDRPMYLLIEDGEAELKDASEIWGMTTWETTDFLQKELGKGVKVSCIGQGGEHLVRVSSTINDKYFSAARGSGAVWGSKNLKAIAVRGTKKVKLAEPDEFRDLTNEDRKFFLEDEFQQDQIAKYGSHIGMLNWSPRQRYEEKVLTPDKVPEQLRPEALKKFEKGRTSCHGCIIRGKDVFEIPSGKYKGERGTGMEYEHMFCLGTNCGIKDPEPLMTMQNLCDKYGMCSLALGNTIAFAKFLYNKGIITDEDTEGLSLEWEDAESQIELVEMTAYREGFGNKVAEGMYNLARIIGGEAMNYCYHTKGLSRGVHSIEVRDGTFTLSHATSTRGADHLRGRSWAYSWIYPKRFDEFQKKGYIPRSTPKLVRYSQVAALIPDLTGRCKCSVNNLPAAVPLAFKYPLWKGVANLLTAATGIEFSNADLEKIADRVYNLERAFNVRQGISRKYDSLPQKPEVKDTLEGKKELEKHKTMLTEYYKVRGWDEETGIPKKETLEELGLKNVADELDRGSPYPEWKGPSLWPLDEYPTRA